MINAQTIDFTGVIAGAVAKKSGDAAFYYGNRRSLIYGPKDQGNTDDNQNYWPDVRPFQFNEIEIMQNDKQPDDNQKQAEELSFI